MNESKQTPQRPGMTREMVRECAMVICKKQEWPDNCADDIAGEYRRHMDAFDLCKELEKFRYWDTTREDMDALDELEGLVERAIKKAEQEWAEQNQITPPFPVGSLVECDRGRGHIAAICRYGVACYQVKPEGQDDEKAQSLRWIIKFEDAKLAE